MDAAPDATETADAVPATPATGVDRRPLVLAAVLFLGLWSLALLRLWSILASYDLGYFTQAAWLLRNGHEPFITVRGIHLLGDHGSFIFYPIAFTFGWLGAPGLLAFQALALAAGVVPLWLLARRVVGLTPPLASALCVAYALYPALSNVNVFDFHPETVVVPALLAAVWLLHRGGPWWAFGLCVAAVLTSREDVAITVLFLGLYGVMQRRVRVGLATAAVAAGWLALDVLVVLPHFAGGSYVQGSRFPQFGDSLGEAAVFMLTHPIAVLDDLTSGANAYVAVGLLAPLLFLPLLGWRHLWPGLPLQVAYLLTNVEAAHTITAQYTVTTIPFMFVGAAFGLRRASERWPERARPDRLAVALVAVAVVGFLVFATASPRHEPWEWARRDAVDRARVEAAELVPSGAPVSATVRMWPLLAERRDLYPFPMPIERYFAQSEDDRTPEERLAALRWVVLDTADGAQWTPPQKAVRDTLLAPGNPLGFRVVYDRFGIVVYHR